MEVLIPVNLQNGHHLCFFDIRKICHYRVDIRRFELQVALSFKARGSI